MDDDSPPNAQFRSESTTVNHGSAPYGGAFFPRSRDFTVSGTFTSVTNNHNEPAVPPDFRRIPFGDINLKHEIRLRNQSGLVDRYQIRGSVRRMHSARIHGDNSDMTVAVYQGDGAEEEWRDHIAKYSSLCHPNFVQIFAAASRSGIHAIVVHDDLIPYNDFLKLLSDSQILTVYIYGCWDRDFREAQHYFEHMFRAFLCTLSKSIVDGYSTFWIRRSTGRLCVDLTPGDVDAPSFHTHEWTSAFDHIPPFHEPNSEANVIDSLELEQYHEVCYWHLGHWQTFPVSTQAELHLGAVVYSPSGSEQDGLDEIAFLPDAYLHIDSWHGNGVNGHTMEGGWTRYDSAEIFGNTIYSWISLDLDEQMAWLSQADHIFYRLLIKSNYEDYALIYWIDLQLEVLAPTQAPPNGYLFVCPAGDLQTGPTSVQWPDCPAYWSLDPSGTERLSTDEATYLGFPSIELDTLVGTRHWDASVYAGLHKFHEAKGFDPDSQDVARHLGYPLFQLSHQMEGPFAHMDEVSNVETETEGGSTATTEDEDEDEGGPTSEHAVAGKVSDVKPEREHSTMATNEDEDGDGSAPEDVDGEILEVGAESEGSSPATNEDEDRDELTPQDECPSLHSVPDVELSWSWEVVMFVKLGLILALGFGSLCEYGRAVLSQRDI